MGQFAGHRRADFDIFNPGGRNFAGAFVIDDFIPVTEQLASRRIIDRGGSIAAVEAAGKRLTGNIIGFTNPDAVHRVTINFVDDHILSNIHQAAGQVTSIGGPQSGISQTFAGAVSRNEVFLRRQAFAEVRADRHRDDTPGGVGHQTAHPGQL